jgi:hypothetical protein
MLNGQRLDAIDTRWVFQVYAAVAGLAGFLLFAWGPMVFGTDSAGEPRGKAAIIRVLGPIMIAAGCCAAGFAAVEPPPARRRGLLWLATGHGAISIVFVSQ